MSRSLKKKVVALGVKREKGWLYFLRGCEVWRMELRGWRNTGEPELVTRAEFTREPNYLYHLDKDGDISCVARSLPRKRRQRLMFD